MHETNGPDARAFEKAAFAVAAWDKKKAPGILIRQGLLKG